MGFIYKDPTNLKVKNNNRKSAFGKLPKTKAQVPLVMNIF